MNQVPPNDQLLNAAARGHQHVVQTALDNGADIEIKAPNGNTALITAAHRGHTKVVAALLERNPNLNAQGQFNKTPLLAALQSDHYRKQHKEWGATIRTLISAGADVNIKDLSGCSPLMSAAGRNDVGITRALLDAGASVNDADNDRGTALTMAARDGGGTVEQIRVLLAAGADPNICPQGDHGRAALLLAARPRYAGSGTDQERSEKVRALLDGGAQIDHQDDNGLTALHYAAQSDSPQTIQILLDHGADATLVNRQGFTAEEEGQGESQKMLKAHRERLALREVSGLTDNQEPVQRARRM